MVAPQKITNIVKDKPQNPKSKSPSPEPFQEPDGMTTIDLNKSDDYSKESELERAELKKRAQIKYLAQLLFALGSIFVIVLLFFMMTFLNKEYHLFTIIPLKTNQSHPLTSDVDNPTLTEEFLNLTRILNQEKFKEILKAGNYIQQFPLEMDLCRVLKSLQFCCDIFKNSDLQDLTPFCSVNDMLNYLIEYEIESKGNQQIYEDYPENEWFLNNFSEDNIINEELDSTSMFKNKKNKRQIHYDQSYEPKYFQARPGSLEHDMFEYQYADPYNDFNQYQPSDQYQSPNEYQHPDQNLQYQQYQQADQYHSSNPQVPSGYQDQNLQATQDTNQEKIKFPDNQESAQQVVIMPQTPQSQYSFPEAMISDIERSNHAISFKDLQNNRNEPRFYLPGTIEQFESFGMGQHLEGPYPSQNNKHNSEIAPMNQNFEFSHQIIPVSDNFFNQNSQIKTKNIDKSSPTLQSVLLPLPERVRENILHHVTVAPKEEHVYKSSEFHQDNYDENHQGYYNFEDTMVENPGRISEDDRRPSIDYNLKVDANGKFHIDSNQNIYEHRQKVKNVDHLGIVKDHELEPPLSMDEIKRPSQTSSVMVGSSLDPNASKTSSQIKISPIPVEQYIEVDTLRPPNLYIQNKELNIHRGPVRLNTSNEEYNRIVADSDSTEIILKSTTEDLLGAVTEASTFHTTAHHKSIVMKHKIQQELSSHNVRDSFDPSTIEPLMEEQPDNQRTLQVTNNIDMIEMPRLADNPAISEPGSNIKPTHQSVDKTDNLNNDKMVTGTSQVSLSEDNKRNHSKSQEILQGSFSRENTGQDIFRGKPKQGGFTASEDTQSNQQTYINPCFNPYMSPYMTFMPPAKVGSAQDPGYLKVVSVSQPQVQNQPMYVLNPSMFYGIPPTSQPAYPSLSQTPFLPQGYFSQVTQSPFQSPLQVASPGGQYYMCNPIPTPSNNIAGLAGVEVRRDASNLQTLMEGLEDFSKSNMSREASTLICPLGEQACLDNIKCIKNHHVCDSEIHCDDSSDEIGCSCKDRVGKLRLCDGYCDCPTCEDEHGCFGCEEDEYSCDDWSRFRRSTCVPVSQRCDGIKQCEITGKDEMDCSILADHIGNFPLNKVSNAVGFLHRNYKGKWYPTCFGTELWAAQVCQVEAGPSVIIPKAHMTLTTDPYNGLFINILPNNEISLVNTCVQDRAAFVECPPLYCGLRFLVNNPYRMHEVDTSIEDMLNDLERAYKLRESDMMRDNVNSDTDFDDTEEEKISLNLKADLNDTLFGSNFNETEKKPRETRNVDLRKRDQLKNAHLEEVIENLERSFRRREVSQNDSMSEILQQSRVVGGKPSQPAAWPWLVSIYKNGIFHCGGVLINELWIVTASHCVDRYWQYYYEIQAGALRRFSYSPMDQRRWAKVVVPHEFYSKSNLRNDIALMKLSAPLRYNKFVRPICLPSEATAGQDFLKGPSPGTICTTVGWGATVEHGADPDHMREVEVPILQHCKHKEDSDIEEICAGLTDGGKDACQGDSGGPLMCRNPNNPNQWYLAGIVSHGEGCARPKEPGVYTKVSRYMGWIAENTSEGKFTVSVPLQKCPGYVCQGTKRCVPKKRRCDRIIDCLLGDDEINCEDHFRQIFKHSRKSMMPSHKIMQAPGNLATDDIVQNLAKLEEFGIVGSPLNDTNIITTDLVDTNTKSDASLDHGMLGRQIQQNIEVEEVYFKCQVMLQVIPANKRCDKILDCEDGTDEFNCTCADYTKNVDPGAICDGVSDCPDLSDENDCIRCNKTEFTCRVAQKCIDISKRCDGTADCPQNEDEMNCASLTNGHSLTLDRDGRPMFKSRGIVTINHLGLWKPLCLNTSSLLVNDEPSIATIICNVLGFDDYFSYHKYLVDNKTINATYLLRSNNSMDLDNTKCRNCCEGLYISCSNTSTSSTLLYKSLEQVKELYFSPWTASVYLNGRYKCMATLLNQYWIVTSVKCFTGITILQGKYITAVFGRGKINLPVTGPHEQIIRVVESITVNETDIVLLRLEQDVKYNRYVQAANLNVRRDTHHIEKCYAVGQDNENRVKFVLLSPLKNCLVGFRCFEKKIEEPCNDIHSWSGTIVCDSRNGWYPAAVFNEESGHCGFHHDKRYTSVRIYKNEIAKIMTQTADPVLPLPCNGLQCNLGNCIPQDKLCDGVMDCHSGEDERSSLCYQKEKDCYTADNCVCPQTHLKCPSNKCFPKSSFCDRVNNCGNFEDEPDICSCKNYLKLTNPEKICDGIVHCMDRSDEDPNICTCKLDDFECGKTNKCVSYDMVCDGIRDCPNGEDEATCLSLNIQSHERTNAGEVMTRTAGLWHTGCFDLNYSTLQLEEICYKLGFSGGSANQLSPPHNITSITGLRPVMDTFDVVWLRRTPGNKLKLRIRSGHTSYVRFVPDQTCHRLFLACI